MIHACAARRIALALTVWTAWVGLGFGGGMRSSAQRIPAPMSTHLAADGGVE
jgi:hypothetical protein